MPVYFSTIQMLPVHGDGFHRTRRRRLSHENLYSEKSLSTTDKSRQQPLSARRGFSIDSLESEKDFPFSLNSLKPGERTAEEFKQEHRKISRSNITKIYKDGLTQETHETSNQQVKKVQSGDISYHEAQHSQQVKNKIEGDGFLAERLAAQRQDQKTLTCGDLTKERLMNSKALATRITTDEGTLENVAMSKEEDRRQLNKGEPERRIFNKEMAASRTLTNANGVTRVSVSNKQSSDALPSDSSDATPSSEESIRLCLPQSSPYAKMVIEIFGDIRELLQSSPSKSDLRDCLHRFKLRVIRFIEGKLLKSTDTKETAEILRALSAIVQNAWAVPSHGHDFGSAVCTALREHGGLDRLLELCRSDEDHSLNFGAARVLEQTLCTENRVYVVDHGLEPVVRVALRCCGKENPNIEETRVGVGLFRHLFKDSEETCSFLIKNHAFEEIVYNCRSSDQKTLQHCAAALANLALYGGSGNEQVMKTFIPWLFPLAFSNDDHVRYWACIAVSAVCLNKELDKAITASNTLHLLETFCTARNPDCFARQGSSNVHGQSKEWLQRFVPVLNSNREEARSLAAFHFAVEAAIKKRQGETQIFAEIGAISALKTVASSPNALASKFAARALQIIGEDIPHKLSQQVPLWTEDDVAQWVKQIGFGACADEFLNTKVDGDLLLQIDEEMLEKDIGIGKQLLRKRFLRELKKLKQMADYSSVDATNVTQILQRCDPEFTQYAYMFLRSGIDIHSLPKITEAQLRDECDVRNSVHRNKIYSYLQEKLCVLNEVESTKKPIDAFISYRRSNGSQLASLLKVHLQIKGFTVFLDVEKLEAGKVDNSLLNSIKEAKSFLLVLSPNALDRCKNDNDCKDWVHKEIVQAIQSGCNIIPIMDNFEWPDPRELPEDIHPISGYNGVNWIHDYQDACVDKIERFIRRERPSGTPLSPGHGSYRSAGNSGHNSSIDHPERSLPHNASSNFHRHPNPQPPMPTPATLPHNAGSTKDWSETTRDPIELSSTQHFSPHGCHHNPQPTVEMPISPPPSVPSD
ncbi:sterile alpha and TIR motif-containing protein 1 [Galendromus occidentalis]|uniref:ADP-ribosyl cyclase/cyclic ADP-ribose hydrolase n=1 Tax=Galendromus occidentalis TaxID=34638 RepID=A0AAJ7SFQ7_9ACAR|nr:sterile alpha and TIR motif-containing protein 1 [Galendromus occidentalis]